MIRAIKHTDQPALVTLIEASGLFQSDELAELETMLTAYFTGNSDREEFWITDDDNGLAGVAYYAPERMTDGTWNVYLIAVHPERQGQGRGAALMQFIEQSLAERGERLLLVETSGVDSFERTRRFYRKCGYEEEARIRDFYSAGDDKIVFRKALVSSEKLAGTTSGTES